MSRSFTSCIAATILVATSLPLCAQQEEKPRFGGTVDVRVVNVEAVVTDSEGKRVTQLGPGDFKLLVDGSEVPIDYFTEIRGSTLVAPAGPKSPPVPASLGAPLSKSKTVATNYLVFIDEVFPLPIDRNAALRGLTALLDRMGPEDRMAIVAYGGHGLDRLCEWTGSLDLLDEVLEEAEDRKTEGFLRRFERESTESQTELRTYVRQLEDQISKVIDAASAAMRTMPAPPGRKLMILLSGGWPLDPTRLLPLTDRTYLTRRGSGRGPETIARLTDTANLLSYSLYPFDVPGLQDRSTRTADEESFDIDEAVTSPSSRGRQVVVKQSPDLEDRLSEIEPGPNEDEKQSGYSLQSLARSTGGKALINTDADRAFGRIVDDTRSYYWLGFDASAMGTNERHQIAVELRKGTYTVRSRRSYLDLSKQAETTMRVESALLFAGDDEEGLEVSFAEPEDIGSGRVRLPVELKISLEHCVAVASGEAHTVHLELRLGALDERGSTSDIPVIPVDFTSETPPGPGSFVRYNAAIELRKTPQEVLVTVYDPLSDRLTAVRRHVDL
jgi:VWFA-related protein